MFTTFGSGLTRRNFSKIMKHENEIMNHVQQMYIILVNIHIIPIVSLCRILSLLTLRILSRIFSNIVKLLLLLLLLFLLSL